MKKNMQHTESFLKGLTTLTGLPYKKVRQYAKENNPFNCLVYSRVHNPYILKLLDLLHTNFVYHSIYDRISSHKCRI